MAHVTYTTTTVFKFLDGLTRFAKRPGECIVTKTTTVTNNDPATSILPKIEASVAEESFDNLRPPFIPHSGLLALVKRRGA